MNSLFNPKYDLVIEKIVDVKAELIWKAWTEPKLIMQWFCPKPWKIVECEIDLRPGGIYRTVMQSPEGQNFPNLGCVLEVVPNKKLVWTSALHANFRPAPVAVNGADLFMTAIAELAPHGNGTKYSATCLHGSEADCKKHADMGFQEGWGICIDQLVELCKKEFT